MTHVIIDIIDTIDIIPNTQQLTTNPNIKINH